jgi:hypothetical protein
MLTDRRQFIETAFLGAAASFITSKSRAATSEVVTKADASGDIFSRNTGSA